MREFHGGSYDVAVIGAGHAGIEAALAAARMGMETVCLTVSLDAVGNMPCNPAIGGTGKGHLVRELDALGGEMARAADKACIQYRMLNRGKGPAVWSLRAQADRRKYQQIMKHTLELQPHLTLRQAEVTEIRCEDGRVTAVVLRTGAVLEVRAVILCYRHLSERAGHYRRGASSSGPDGMQPANAPGRTPAPRRDWPCAGSRPARPPRIYRGAWISARWRCRRATHRPCPFALDASRCRQPGGLPSDLHQRAHPRR